MSDQQTPAELRDALEAAQKELKRQQKAAEDALNEARGLKRQLVVQETGLDSRVVDLFVAANPEADLTPDALQAFAEDYHIGVPGTVQSEDAPAEEAKETTGLDGFARAGSRTAGDGTAPIDQKFLTRDEFVALSATNPAEAKKALAEGRVKLNNHNPFAEGAQPGLNPFLASKEVG